MSHSASVPRLSGLVIKIVLSSGIPEIYNYRFRKFNRVNQVSPLFIFIQQSIHLIFSNLILKSNDSQSVHGYLIFDGNSREQLD